jgi:hypothetical protein
VQATQHFGFILSMFCMCLTLLVSLMFGTLTHTTNHSTIFRWMV